MHVLVHGGAGSAPDDPEARQAVLEDAAAEGTAAANPEAAVVAAVRRLETNPRFNAGVGSAVQSDGTVRTDAGLMTGDGASGAACAMPGVEHAVDVARLVKRETPHVLLAGERAVALAAAFDVETDRDLWTPETRERWRDADPPAAASMRDHLSWVRERFGEDGPTADAGTGSASGTADRDGPGDRNGRDHDTVGAVATDGERLAAATSTGGRWFALAGRVGDVPQVGAGFYATSGAAASATGEGEAIARFGLARRAVAAAENGGDPATAADRAVTAFEDETGASAGVVVVDADGRRGRAANTEAMQTATGARRG